jgi:hypothetical protein
MPGDSARLGFRLRSVRSHLPTLDRSLRTLLVGLLLAAAAVAALSHTTSAYAATKCGQAVLLDWYDNGRIDKLYPLHCYEEGIDAIPNDIGPYSDAQDVIFRALQGAMHGNLGKGGCDPSPDGSVDDCTGSGGSGGTGGTGGKGGNGGGSGGGSGTPQVQDETPTVNTSSASSVPIPLLVLGSMSILLLAAGGLGYLSRRRQHAHADDVGDSGDAQL